MPYRKVSWALCVASGVSLIATSGFADTTVIDTGATDTRRAEVYEVTTPGKSVRMGGARITVDAPIRAVRTVLTDYGHYADFLPEFRKSRIIAKSPTGTDVYLEVPILHGAARLWTVARFTGPIGDSNNGERIEGHQLGQGNIDELQAIWRVRSVDDSHTLIALELLLVPKLPVPSTLLNGELREAAERAVTATRARVELTARAHALTPPEVAAP